MTSLNEVFGINEYCGPGVLSALTGRSTDHCAAVISAVSGSKQIKAVQIPHLLEAAKRLGFEVEEMRPFGHTVYGTISGLVMSGARDSRYIIYIKKHVIALEISADRQAYLIDNQSKTAINAGSSARLTQPVIQIFRLKGKTPQQLAEEARQQRIEYIKRQIHILTEGINFKIQCRNELERELESLNDDETNRS